MKKEKKEKYQNKRKNQKEAHEQKPVKVGKWKFLRIFVK
jgi:hypothetical protein